MINIHISGPQGCGKTRIEALLAEYIMYSGGTVITDNPIEHIGHCSWNELQLRNFFDRKTIKITTGPETPKIDTPLHMYLGADA